MLVGLGMHVVDLDGGFGVGQPQGHVDEALLRLALPKIVLAVAGTVERG